VRQSQRDLELVRGDLGVASALERAGNGGGARADGSPSDAEGVHGGWSDGEDQLKCRSCWCCEAQVLRLGLADKAPCDWLASGMHVSKSDHRGSNW
jgi:hypothetical protein